MIVWIRIELNINVFTSVTNRLEDISDSSQLRTGGAKLSGYTADHVHSENTAADSI